MFTTMLPVVEGLTYTAIYTSILLYLEVSYKVRQFTSNKQTSYPSLRILLEHICNMLFFSL